MKWPRKFRRKPPLPRITDEQIRRMLRYLGEELRREPVVVQHEVRRHIPRPTVIEFIVERNDGTRYNLGSRDLSFKHSTVMVNFPVQWLTGREEDIPAGYATVHAILHYDPKDT